MADNIKIVGNILNIDTVSRYDIKDTNLITSQRIAENFGGEGDYIEFYIYDGGGNLLNINYDYLSYKLPSDIGLTPGTSTPPNTTGNIQTTDVGIDSTLSTPTSSLYPIIEIDPVKDLQDIGYSSGEFNVRYNIFHNKLSNFQDKALFVKEISQDRTEIRLASTTLTNDEIESTVLSIIDEINNSPYFVDYLLNFGVNNQYVAVNVALNKAPEGYEVLFKLYQPLPLTIQEKQTLWIVEEKTTPYVFDVNLDKLIIAAPAQQLRGPNFGIEIPNQSTISTQYNTYSNLVTGLQSLQQTSYHQILNLLATQSVNINIDYTNFNNFVFFGSAYQRIANFYTKIQQIEDYNNFISANSSLTSSTPSLITEINTYSSSISTIISQFDGYESYLYFESSSYTWPKSGSAKPFSLLSTGSAAVLSWYPALTSSAQTYDETNYNNLEYAVPTFIKDDDTNAPFLLFLNMIGHYFDNIWIYLGAVTDTNLANNNLNYGISKDLVYNQLQSLGIKLYNSQAGESVDQFLVGANTGSSIWDNNTTTTGSYLNNIPRKDLVSELYKRIYHNLPLLLKTKGTVAGLEHLTTIFGITGSILNVKEFGGSLKSNLINGYNNDKVRIVDNSIAGHPSGSVLSPFLSLQTFPVTSSQFRDNDMNYVDISFSPQTQIDTYVSGAIASNNPTWSLDDYIGDPRQQYSGSYPDLDAQRKLYFETGVSGFPPFTGSLMDYNGFIRLIQYFDNALFKMLNDFVPERTSLSTGVTFNSPVLERNKAVYANPSNSTTQSVYDGEVSSSTISSTYGTFYNALSSSNNTMGWFDGELSGSIVNIGQYFEDNPNPYLGDWDVWNAQHSTTQSINYNSFAHSDWNVLLNNVSKSVVSNIRKKIEYTGNFLPTSSITSSVELQDSYLSLRSYNVSRYEGSKLTSKLYNTYTSGSYTGSDGRTIQNGDNSYGKTAAIDRQSYKVGWVKNIPSIPLNFRDKTQIQLKYLIDKAQNITDLTLKNNNLVEVQNTFKTGENVVLSLSDALNPSFQKNLDGTKSIFKGGFSFDPILFREGNESLTFSGFKNTSNIAGIRGLDYVKYTNIITNSNTDGLQNQQGSFGPPTFPLTTTNNGANQSSSPTVIPLLNWNYTQQWLSLTSLPPGIPASFPKTTGQNETTTTLYSGNRPGGLPTGYPKYWFTWDNNWINVKKYTQTNIIDPLTQTPTSVLLYFNEFSSSLRSGYTTTSPGFYIENTDVTCSVGDNSFYFNAPVPNTYTLNATVPIDFYMSWNGFGYTGTGAAFSDRNQRVDSMTSVWDGTTNYRAYRGFVNEDRTFNTTGYKLNDGFNIKIGGIIEMQSPNGQWSYVASLRIDPNSIDNTVSTADGYNFDYNVLRINAGGGGSTTINTSLYPLTIKYLRVKANLCIYDDISSSTSQIIKGKSVYIPTTGNKLRMSLFIADVDGAASIAKSVKFDFGTIDNNNVAFWEVLDPATIITQYYTTSSITIPNVFTPNGPNSNIINFDQSVVPFFTTESIFIPSGSTEELYSPIIDLCTIQPNDLIRIGSILNPSPSYYTVLTTTSGVPAGISNNSTTISAGFVVSDNRWKTITGATANERRSTIIVPYTSINLLFFNSIAASTARTFTTSLTSFITFTIPSPLYVSSDANYIYIAVSNNIDTPTNATPTLTSNLGVTQVTTAAPWTLLNAPTVTFTANSGVVFTNGFSVTLDKPLVIPTGLNPAQDFAILRPKPDETSVIINFRKSIGEVSQTILIPQDASDEIKNSVGTIFQSLNVDLSNK